VTQEQLQDALGMIDDDLIKSVDKLRQETAPENISNHIFQGFRKNIVRRETIKWGSLAASVCLLVGVGFLWTVGGSKSADYAPNAGNHYSHQENLEDVYIEDNHYIKPESASPTTTKPETSPQETLPSDVTPPYPILSVSNKEASFDADFYQVYWFFTDAEGMSMWVTSESIHPLDCKDCLVRLNTSLPFLNLHFKNAPRDPEHITVHYWDETCWNDHSAEFQTMTVENGQLSLVEGGYIYEIVAQWGSDQGTMSYCFYADYSPE
jgi:hypothetical protein